MNTEIHPRAVHRAHPLAAIFPMTAPDTLAKTIEDMKGHGFDPKHPIVLFEGCVLDGRNRLHCAIEANVEPVFRQFDPTTEGTPHEFVTRENMNRRHMSPSQRAAVAADLLPFYQQAETTATTTTTPPPTAQETSPPQAESSPPPPSSEHPAQPAEAPTPTETAAAPAPVATRSAVAAVAAATGAKPTNVKQAAKLKKEAPDLHAKVESGAMTINAAMTALKERKASAETRAKKAKEKTEREEALKAIASIHGSESDAYKAAKEKKMLKTHDDLLVFSTMDKITGAKLVPLLAKGWRIAKAQKFLANKLLPESSIEDLINTAIATENDPFEIKINGYWITVSKDEGDSKNPEPAAE